MGLGIKVNGTYLDLPENTRTKIVSNNPALGDTIPGSYSLTIDIPHSPKNDKLLGYTNLKETYASGFPSINNVDVYHNDIFFHRCKLRVNHSNEKRFQCYLQIGLSSLAENLKALKLNDLTFPDVTFNSLTDIKTILDDKINNPVDWTVFPVVNGGLWGGKDQFDTSAPNLPDWILAAGGGGYPLINSYNPPIADPWFGGNGMWSWAPFPFMNPVIKKIFAQLGSHIKGSWFDDAELNMLCFFNSRVLPIYVSGGTHIMYHKKMNLAYHLPTISAAELLSNITTMFAQGFYSRPDGTIEMIAHKDVLSSSDVDDWTNKATIIYEIDGSTEGGYTLEHQEDGSDETFSKKKKQFNEVITIQPPVTTFSALPPSPQPNDVVLVLDENYYYMATYPGGFSLVWTKWRTEDFIPVITGDGANRIESKMPPLFIERDGLIWPSFQGLYLRPEVHQPASLELNEFKTELEDVKPRLMFYRGLQPISPVTSFLYPLGSGREYNYLNQQVGNYSLDWSGQYGLYNTWWADWVRFLEKTRPVKMQLLLTINDIKELKYDRKKRIGSQLYLLRKIEYDLPYTGKATAELMKIG